MAKWRVRIGWLVAVIGLTAATWQAGMRWQASALFLRDGLRPCGLNTDLFAPVQSDGDGAVVRWSEQYHQTVSGIVEAHLGVSTQQIECSGQPRTRPSGPLSEVASQMEPWKSGTEFYEEDMMPILSAYLETYECALRAYRARHYGELLRQASALPRTNSVFPFPSLNSAGSPLLPPLVAQWFKEVPLIEHELALARPALQRTFTYLNGQDRLRALDINLTCLERASLDIRNSMSLAAEASACFPSRIWDSRGGLYKPQ